MIRRVFFSFHRERDDWRANVVRNRWVTKDKEDRGFIDAAEYEKIKKEGDKSVKRWINRQLQDTTVTAVLIGKETSSRKWVRYAVKRSHERGNGLLGIYIHKIKNKDQKTDEKGNNGFGEIDKNEKGKPVYFRQLYPTYDWKENSGYRNIGDWIEKSGNQAL